jgi:hypothetical protein
VDFNSIRKLNLKKSRFFVVKLLQYVKIAVVFVSTKTMRRIFTAILLLSICMSGYGQGQAGRWTGSGEYLPGMSVSDMMKQMAAEKKLMFEIGPTGIVSGRLTTVYRPKAVIPHEGGDQNFILSGKYDPYQNKLLLVITHFRSRPDSSESYLTFVKPDSVYYDVSVDRNGEGSVITGVANSELNTNANTEWVGSFKGGGLNMDAGNNSMHILPLRIRFDIAGIQSPVNSIANAVYRDTVSEAPTNERIIHTAKYVVPRERKIQRTILLDTSHIKIELYDNGQVDGDIATLIFDGKTVINKQQLSTKPAVLTLDVTNIASEHILELYADNLGSIPPNTALVVLTCKGKRYEINLSSDEGTNGAVKLVFRH